MNIINNYRSGITSKIKLVILGVTLGLLTACASNGKLVPRGQAYKSVSYGTITATEDVIIGGSQSGVGAYIASAAAIHDATSRSFLGFLARGLVGSAVGAAAEERVTRKPGKRYSVDISSGRSIEVLSRNVELQKGDCVEIIRARRGVEIRPTASGPCAAPIKRDIT